MVRLLLIKHGIPFHHAFDLAPDEYFFLDRSWLLTFAIGLGSLEGRRYDWNTRRWRSK